MRSLACLVVLLVGSSAEASSPAPLDYVKLQSDLEASRALWQSKDSTTYTMRYQVDCFCPAEYRDPVMEQVVDSKVTCAVYAKGSESGCGKAKYNGTIEHLFSMVDSAIKNRACDIQVSYDSQLGYPTSVYTTSSCGISDIPVYKASEVRLGTDKHVCDTHHHRWGRHRLGHILVLVGGVSLLVIIIGVAVCCVRRYRRRRAVTLTKKVGDAKYLNLQEPEAVEADPDRKKVPLV